MAEPNRPASPGVPASSRDAATDMPEPATLDALLEAERDTLKHYFPPPPRRGAKRRKTAGVAVALATLLLGGLIWLDPAYRQQAYATTAGATATVALPDGGTITLDTATQLHVSWHLRSRRVALQQGQALFDVAPAWRPLLVSAADTHIRVLGTVFNVRLDAPRQVTVAVRRGQVAVSQADSATATVTLQAGQAVTRGTGTAPPPVAADLDTLLAWQQGRLVFERTPLYLVVAELQRYHGKPIRLRDQRIAMLTLSGVFETRHTAQLLALLPQTLPVRIAYQRDGSIDIVAP